MHETARRDRPDRPASPLGVPTTEADIAASLRQRIPRITEHWHRDLLAHLKVRPQAVFPGDDLLDHMPIVVDHVIGLIEVDSEVPEGTLAALRAVADHWRNAGYTIEESLLHFRILNRVLHEELRALLEVRTPPLPGTLVARIAESLSHGSSLVQAVVVGSYRDREEERFAEYASFLSHEVRGPLSAAVASLQRLTLLDQREPDAQVEEQRRQTLDRLERSLWQVRDVLDAVRALVVPVGGTAGPEEERPLSDVVGTVLAEFRARQDDVVIRSEGEIPDMAVRYQTVLLVLHNLVQNAVSYSDPEKPERWVRLRYRYDEAGKRCLLSVRDNGLGIPEREQELIFRRFRRGAGAGGQGFGLGLSIAREAARRMDGDISVESEPGEGSTFTFAFPAKEVGSVSKEE